MGKEFKIFSGHTVKDSYAREQLEQLKEYIDEQIRALRGDDSDMSLTDIKTMAGGMIPTNKLYWLEGTETVTSSDTGSAEIAIDKPEWMNFDDCIVIGVMTKNILFSNWRTVFNTIPAYISEGVQTEGARRTLNPSVSFIESTSQIQVQIQMQENVTKEISYKILIYDRSRG